MKPAEDTKSGEKVGYLFLSRYPNKGSRPGSRSFLVFGLVAAAALVGARSDGLCGEPREVGVKELIEQLASPNPAPTWPDGDVRSKPVYPPGYDQTAQAAIMRKWDALLDRKEAAFPRLIDSLDDTRYSCTTHEGIWENLTVGDVCSSIVKVSVGVSSRFMRREDQERHVPSWIGAEQGEGEFAPTVLRRWWAKNKGKTLRELQLAGTDWAIAYERKKGFEDKTEEAKIMGGLERLRKRLDSSKEPICVDRMGDFLGADLQLDPDYVPPSDLKKTIKHEDPFAPGGAARDE
jgi:ribosomal protein L39E